jgi:SMODS and SLOG-associating 2TM effector domain family 5
LIGIGPVGRIDHAAESHDTKSMSTLRKPRLVVTDDPSNAAWQHGADLDDHLADLRRDYLHDWAIVKRARFNAAKRYERKQQASNLAFATLGVVGFMLPYFLLNFHDLLSATTHKLLDFVGYATGLFALVIGLVELARGYESMARRLNTSALEVNSALRKLRATPRIDQDTLNHLVAEYEAALERCDINHDDIDREIAQAQQSHHETRAAPQPQHLQRLSKLKWREFFEIWGMYLFILPLPGLCALVLWVAL